MLLIDHIDCRNYYEDVAVLNNRYFIIDSVKRMGCP